MNSTLPLISKTIMILAFLFLANICATTTTAKAQPCSEEFTKLVHQKNMTKCKTLRNLGAQFGWNYQNNTNYTTLEILFGANITEREKWIAWGVNPGKRAEMIGTQALIGIKYHADGDTTWKVHTYNITKETKRGCSLVPSKIDLQVSNMLMEHHGSNFYTIYARLILPSDVYNITRLNHVWQVGDEIVDGKPLSHPRTLHNVDSTETIDLTSEDGRSSGQSRSYLRSVHGVLNIIGWGTLLPMGVIIARYFRVFPFKCDRIWFFLHIGTQLSGFLIGTAGWVIGLSLGNSSRYYTFETHRVFGIIIFTFSTVQMLAFRLKPSPKDDYRKYWNMYHHFLGYGLLAIICINIFKGIKILHGGPGWRWCYIGILIFFGVIVIGLEVFTWVWFFILKLRQTADKANPNKDKSSNPRP